MADRDPEQRAENAKAMQDRRDAVRALVDAGLGLLVSSSGGYYLTPGFSMHVEFECLTDAGLTPAEILQGATLNAALCVGREKEWGSLQVGLVADLVLLEADPLDDLRNAQRIIAVVRRGRIYEREEIQSRLDALVSGYRKR